MHFTIRHITRYSYGRPVSLEPVTIRLRPREDVRQRLVRYELRTVPEPSFHSEIVDAEGNHSACLHFEGEQDFLSLVTTSEVDTLSADLSGPAGPSRPAGVLPVEYPQESRALLTSYLQRMERSDELEDLTGELIEQAQGVLMDFLELLCGRLSTGIRQVRRERGEPLPPSRTLTEGEGSCRDVSVLFMEACRCAGLAARFVSGYVEGFTQQGLRELHAWSEVYTPDRGWCGFDPSMGQAVLDRHVALAGAALPSDAAPVTGSFRGADVESHLWYDISIVAH